MGVSVASFKEETERGKGTKPQNYDRDLPPYTEEI